MTGRRGRTPAWLRRQRAALVWTQVELAHALGYSSTSLARMERGEQAIPRVVVLAVEALMAEAALEA